jgi:CRP-like cAMP-binding protein
MTTVSPSPSRTSRNRLLAALPPAERALIEENSTLVALGRRDVLYEPEKPIPYVYFPVDGIASVVAVMTDGTGVETATVGREGMVGLPVFHRVDVTAEQALVQVPGAAYRMEASKFRELLPRLTKLDALLHRFAVVMFTLASQNSACNRKHSIVARCARWLLMVADRLEAPTMELTHDFVAQMLGVRRASVTESLGELERQGLIQTGRGRITIVNRDALLHVACECYGIVHSVTRRLLDNEGEASPLAGIETSDHGKSTLREPHG